MRIYALILASLLLAGCAPAVENIPGFFVIRDFDVSMYSAKGFLFTPSEYKGDYEAIGWLSVEFSPEANLKVKTEEVPLKRIEGTWMVGKHHDYWEFESSNSLNERTFRELYTRCTSMGADALTLVTVTETANAYNVTKGTGGKLLVNSQYRIDGFAIKRLGAFK